MIFLWIEKRLVTKIRDLAICLRENDLKVTPSHLDRRS
ncbi:hypothetical protein KSS87_021996 [Heliosperma pusillum]|nr:hypothetical protein KSS87_021996 [Heliosperma pusillum]